MFKHILFANYIDKMDKTQVKQTYEIVSKLKVVTCTWNKYLKGNYYT